METNTVSKTQKVAILLCGGDINFSQLPIITNKSNAMIPVNGKPVIGWIIDDLIDKGIKETVLVLRFDNDKLFNYIEWAFSKRLVVHYAFVQPGGTILHSLLAGMAWIKPGQGVHIILGDTLIKDSFEVTEDFVFAGDYENPEDWCLIEINADGTILNYYDKINEQKEGLKALAGVYSLADTNLLRILLMQSIKSGAKEISHILRLYGETRPVSMVAVREWYDFGHINYFNKARRTLLQSRYFNSLEIDPLFGTISKKSVKSDKLEDELNWYTALPERLKLLCPRIIKNSSNEGETIIQQEFYGYPTLAELYVFGDISFSVWTQALKQLMNVHNLFLNERGRIDRDDIQNMYLEKTENRLSELRKDPFWESLLKKDTLNINGIEYSNYCKLSAKVKEKVSNLANNNEGCIIHGDYCFSNILYDLNSQLVRLIDPRGSFGKQKKFGDPRYDMAKLRHSISGLYDFIMADLFSVENKNDKEFKLTFSRPEHYGQVCEYFDALLNQYKYNAMDIRFIEGILFISMVPYHQGKFHRQLAMYLNGIIILNQVFDYENRY